MVKKILVTLVFTIFIFNINIYANNYFRIEKNDQLINIDTIKVYDINNNVVGNKNWSSAVILNNGNVIVGEHKTDNSFNYYEITKEGKQTLVTNSKYYILDFNAKTESFITISEENNKFYLGVLDKEFNTIYENIFEYKEKYFEEDIDILKVKNKGYGVFSISGEVIIEPIFDSIIKINDKTYKCVSNNKEYTLVEKNGRFINETTIQNVDSWAKESVTQAVNLGIVPQNIQLKLNEYITREEFCQLIINLYEEKTAYTIPVNIKNPFVDTNSEAILKAYSLGIISGKSSNKFAPNDYITREESAVVLSKLINKMEYSTTELFFLYKDNNEISDWAKDHIQVVSNGKIMSGDTKGNFNPKDKFKVVEAISTITRLYNLK